MRCYLFRISSICFTAHSIPICNLVKLHNHNPNAFTLTFHVNIFENWTYHIRWIFGGLLRSMECSSRMFDQNTHFHFVYALNAIEICKLNVVLLLPGNIFRCCELLAWHKCCYTFCVYLCRVTTTKIKCINNKYRK